MSSVDMDFLTRRLAEVYGDEAVVASPDHPLLLRSPDILTAINGNLTAIFAPHALEERNPAHLATRLISSRLALPVHTKTVLLLSERQEDRFGSLLAEFSLVTAATDRSISAFLAEKRDSRTTPEIEPAIRKFTVRQMDRTFSATESGFRANRVARRKDFSAEYPSNRHQSRIIKTIGDRDLHYTPMNRTLVGGEWSSILDAGTKQNLRRQILNTTSGCILESYRSENGYIRALREEPHMAIAYHIDEIFGLRNKITMASAFSGVFLVPDDNPEVVRAASSRWRKFEVSIYE